MQHTTVLACYNTARSIDTTRSALTEQRRLTCDQADGINSSVHCTMVSAGLVTVWPMVFGDEKIS